MRDKIWPGFCGVFALMGTLFAISAWGCSAPITRSIRECLLAAGFIYQKSL